jgi:hypothetical protein
MDKETNREFISKTESLVKPQDVTAINFSFIAPDSRRCPATTLKSQSSRGCWFQPW